MWSVGRPGTGPLRLWNPPYYLVFRLRVCRFLPYSRIPYSVPDCVQARTTSHRTRLPENGDQRRPPEEVEQGTCSEGLTLRGGGGRLSTRPSSCDVDTIHPERLTFLQLHGSTNNSQSACSSCQTFHFFVCIGYNDSKEHRRDIQSRRADCACGYEQLTANRRHNWCQKLSQNRPRATWETTAVERR